MLNDVSPALIVYVWQNSFVDPGLTNVVSACSTVLIVNLALSNTPSLAVPLTQKLTWSSTERPESWVAVRSVHPVLYALISWHWAVLPEGGGVPSPLVAQLP